MDEPCNTGQMELLRFGNTGKAKWASSHHTQIHGQAASYLCNKFAGAPTEQFGGDPADAISRLKATLPIYSDLKHKNLIELIEAKEMAMGSLWYSNGLRGLYG